MAVLAFVLAWILIGITVFFIALRGGPSGAREALHSQTRAGARANYLLLSAIALLGIAVPTLVLIGNRDSAHAGNAQIPLNHQQERGRELFAKNCSQCHTLAEANAVGTQGPNFDQLKPPKALVVDAVLNGRVRGNGTMPARLLAPSDAAAVGAFVQKVAGRQ